MGVDGGLGAKRWNGGEREGGWLEERKSWRIACPVMAEKWDLQDHASLEETVGIWELGRVHETKLGKEEEPWKVLGGSKYPAHCSDSWTFVEKGPRGKNANLGPSDRAQIERVSWRITYFNICSV